MDNKGKTDIINTALLYMNQDTILDPSGSSKSAKLCAQVYDTVLAECLSSHPWNFATRSVFLQRLAESPTDPRFERQYQLPVDLGRIREVNSGSASPAWMHADDANARPRPAYAVQGARILTNAGSLCLVYTRSGVAPHEMPPLFRDYFAAKIAERLFFKVDGRGGNELAVLQKRVLEKEVAARHGDGVEAENLPSNRPGLFLNVRRY